MEGLIGLGIGVVIICVVFFFIFLAQKRRFKKEREGYLNTLNENFAAIDRKFGRTSHRANLVNKEKK